MHAVKMAEAAQGGGRCAVEAEWQKVGSRADAVGAAGRRYRLEIFAATATKRYEANARVPSARMPPRRRKYACRHQTVKQVHMSQRRPPSNAAKMRMSPCPEKASGIRERRKQFWGGARLRGGTPSHANVPVRRQQRVTYGRMMVHACESSAPSHPSGTRAAHAGCASKTSRIRATTPCRHPYGAGKYSVRRDTSRRRNAKAAGRRKKGASPCGNVNRPPGKPVATRTTVHRMAGRCQTPRAARRPRANCTARAKNGNAAEVQE